MGGGVQRVGELQALALAGRGPLLAQGLEVMECLQRVLELLERRHDPVIDAVIDATAASLAYGTALCVLGSLANAIAQIQVSSAKIEEVRGTVGIGRPLGFMWRLSRARHTGRVTGRSRWCVCFL